MQETYNELRITPHSDYSLFVDVLLSLSDEAIEEDGRTIILRSVDNLDMVAFGIQAFAEHLAQTRGQSVNVSIEQSVKENEDWISAYRNGIQPLHVGEFYIHPSWVADAEDKKNIIIDPALAFGSGHHETTFGCLMMLQKYILIFFNTLLNTHMNTFASRLC